MGAGGMSGPHLQKDCDANALPATAVRPLIVGLQPAALVDHVARVEWSLLDRIPGDRGGSQQVEVDDLQHILCEVNAQILPVHSKLSPIKAVAGGSVANTIRGLAAGFGIPTGIIGACGNDDQGLLFIRNMNFNQVDLSSLIIKKGLTGQCVCLVDDEGNRTMRPCLSSAVKLQANELKREDIRGSQWLVMRYAHLNMEIINAAIKFAKLEGVCISLDLASFEMVRNHRSELIELLKTGNIDLCFANEDEARELIRGEPVSGPEAAVGFLAKYCRWAVVTLGPKGCMANQGNVIVRVPAMGDSRAVDSTGAGDLFVSGFLYGMVKGLSVEDCCRVGSCSGGAVVRSLSGEVRPENWQWMYRQMKSKGIPPPAVSLVSS